MTDRVRYRVHDGKRVKVVLNDGFEGFEVRWTASCSGCFEFNEGWGLDAYDFDAKHKCYIGGGCSECGYTGKRRESFWVPFDSKAWNRHANAWWYEREERRAKARAEGLMVMP